MTYTDPNATRFRESRQQKTLFYAENEQPVRQVALRFVKYSRLNPADAPTEEPTTIIFLPMPMNAPENSNIRTNQTDLNLWGPLESGFNNMVTSGAAPLTDQLKRSLAGASVTQTPTDVLSSITAIAPFTKDNVLRQLYSGKVLNPHTTSLFEGVSIRNFNLAWRFSPQSEEQSNSLNDILKELDVRSHPEENILSYGLVLEYPDLVYVDFIGDSAKYLPKYRKAFLTSIQKSVGSGSGISFYTSGAPVEVELALTFTEVEVVTRNILEGRSLETISTASTN